MKNADDKGTAAALLDAARFAFAHQGYEGASVRTITAAAGANLGAVTYHYGSKRALYEAVILSCVMPLHECVQAAAEVAGSVLDRVEAVVRAYFDYLGPSPEVVLLIVQEVMQTETPPAAALPAMRGIHGLLTGLIREGQRDGSIRDGVPAIMAISIVSQPVHLMLMRPRLQFFTGMDLGERSILEGFVENAVAFVRGGLAPRTN